MNQYLNPGYMSYHIYFYLNMSQLKSLAEFQDPRIHLKLLNQKLHKWDKFHRWDLDTCFFSELHR